MQRKILPIFLLFVHQSGLFCAENWNRVTTPHFELYTQVNQRDATRALEMLEETRSVFQQIGFAQSVPGQLVRIIDLSDDREYSNLLVKPGAYGCYQRGRRGDYIILRDLRPEHYVVAVHEYTHFVVEHAGLKLPVWLNEGIAELYSTIQSRGAQCVVGRAQPGRLLALETYKRLPLETLFSADSSSRYYNNPEEMQIFYAESWALTHMLALGDGYTQHFNSFLQAVSSGLSTEAALRGANGKGVRSVEADLDAYLRQKSLPAVMYRIEASAQPWQATAASLSQAELDLSAADLLASNAWSGPEAEEKVRELARKHPNDAGFEETLGYLALRYNRSEEARSHFATAVEQRSEDPATIYNSARLQQAAGAAPAQTIPLLERVLALNPDYEPARLDLGFTAARAGRFELALSAFSQLKAVQPKFAFEVLYTMAYCEAQLRRGADAGAFAAQAQQYAHTADQRERLDMLRRFLDRLEVAALRH